VTAVQERLRTPLPEVAEPPTAAASGVKLLAAEALELPAPFIARTLSEYAVPFVSEPIVKVVAAEPVATQVPEVFNSYA
jgi:hypothetical protein